MSSTHRDSDWPIVWIDASTPLPDTCMTCGMFSDSRTKVPLVQQQAVVTDPESSAAHHVAMGLGCLFHIFLGPLGWLLSALMHSRQDKGPVNKIKNIKWTLRLPQCRLCTSAEPVRPVSEPRQGGAMFQVHPVFARRLEQAAPRD